MAMAVSKQKRKYRNLREIPGYPGLYTPITVTRDARREKAMVAKIKRNAQKIFDRYLETGILF